MREVKLRKVAEVTYLTEERFIPAGATARFIIEDEVEARAFLRRESDRGNVATVTEEEYT